MAKKRKPKRPVKASRPKAGSQQFSYWMIGAAMQCIPEVKVQEDCGLTDIN